MVRCSCRVYQLCGHDAGSSNSSWMMKGFGSLNMIPTSTGQDDFHAEEYTCRCDANLPLMRSVVIHNTASAVKTEETTTSTPLDGQREHCIPTTTSMRLWMKQQQQQQATSNQGRRWWMEAATSMHFRNAKAKTFPTRRETRENSRRDRCRVSRIMSPDGTRYVAVVSCGHSIGGVDPSPRGDGAVSSPAGQYFLEVYTAHPVCTYSVVSGKPGVMRSPISPGNFATVSCVASF